jgi:hypothetical protein
VKGYIFVEGHGDVAAAGNLVARLSLDLGIGLVWGAPIRWKNLHREEGVIKAAQYARRRSDVAALLLLRDEDDACPRVRGPAIARILQGLSLPFPSAVVLFHREYEVLFLPCLPSLAGKPLGEGASLRSGILAGTRFDGNWESVRGVKEWLSEHFPSGRTYKPSMDQLPLTRLLDFAVLRAANVPCFGTLERALGFLAAAQSGVYPAP